MVLEIPHLDKKLYFGCVKKPKAATNPFLVMQCDCSNCNMIEELDKDQNFFLVMAITKNKKKQRITWEDQQKVSG